ncbi:hypothetical protein BDZ97DRAFT_1871436 [Flammula alnicola]|nr:hypothetical protein BDZ97DRAFT_1871436 [Flammula alnicola]
MHVPHTCFTCRQIFDTLGLLSLHCSSLGHHPNPFYCIPCGLSFNDLVILQQHVDLHFYMLSQSADQLVVARPVQQATTSVVVSLAAMDGRDPTESVSAQQNVPYCAKCDRFFVSQVALDAHLRTSSTHRPPKPPKSSPKPRESHRCSECDRGFKSASKLTQHTNSLAHKNRALSCPIVNCSCKFKSASGVAHHVESGKAHPEISRHDVTHAIQTMDVNGTISINRRISGPSNVSGSASTITYIATQESFNGKHYVCFLCSKMFRAIDRLNAHLNSPAHDADEFKCPQCCREFKLVSALTQHIEAGGCTKNAAAITPAAHQIERYIESLSNRLSRQIQV